MAAKPVNVAAKLLARAQRCQGWVYGTLAKGPEGTPARTVLGTIEELRKALGEKKR